MWTNNDGWQPTTFVKWTCKDINQDITKYKYTFVYKQVAMLLVPKP